MSSTQQQGIGLVENGGPGTPSRDTYDEKQRTLFRESGVRVSPPGLSNLTNAGGQR
jgi:hypothetical protein